MAWWAYLIGGGLVILAGVVCGIVFAIWRTRSAARAESRIRAGRHAAVAVMVLTDQLRRGRAFGDGRDIRMSGRGVAYVVDRSELSTAAVRRDQIDDQLAEFAQLRGLTDEDGTHIFVGPPDAWAPAYESLVCASVPRLGRLRVLGLAMPRAALITGVVALALAGVFQAIWWTGHDQVATVISIGLDEEGYGLCQVAWEDAGRTEETIVDCYEPLPSAGDHLTVRVLPWPFRGEALDHEGSYEGLTSVTAGPALALLGTAVGVGLARAIRRPVRLQRTVGVESEPATPDGQDLQSARSGAGSVVAPPGGARPVELGDLTIRELIRRVGVLEGWADEADAAPSPPTAWQFAGEAARSPIWWVLVPLLALAGLADDMPMGVRLAIVVIAGVVLVWTIIRTARSWFILREVAAQPITSEWDYLVFRSVAGEWFLFLVLGQTPYWAIGLPERRHPIMAGRCGVRGTLFEGSAVNLVIDDEIWVPTGPVMREDDESRALLREDLTARLEPATPPAPGPSARS
ncbi:hypothetical protein [Occultella aeris]|uniref:hypothetical protein n=1 Tax=Occultella aeris TaxID=2761496 RepID=UPI0012E9F161|nr:hypothetical protein [Occultella aeris]